MSQLHWIPLNPHPFRSRYKTFPFLPNYYYFWKSNSNLELGRFSTSYLSRKKAIKLNTWWIFGCHIFICPLVSTFQWYLDSVNHSTYKIIWCRDCLLSVWVYFGLFSALQSQEKSLMLILFKPEITRRTDSKYICKIPWEKYGTYFGYLQLDIYSLLKDF